MRGFKDNFPPYSNKIEAVLEAFRKISSLYGVAFVDLPLVEEVDLFMRTSGEDSDIVGKELFSVARFSKSEEEKEKSKTWALRPEGTAGMMRAIKENNILNEKKECRFAYIGPMFRYNRPQAGRYRQFSQVGWEFIGTPGPEIEAEAIIGAYEFASFFGLNFELEINNIGSLEDRKNYRQELQNYFEKQGIEISSDPIKMVDKRDKFEDNFPQIKINLEDKKNFSRLREILEKNKIPYKHNKFLVRGLDYYNSTVFELKQNGKETQGALIAGGRYDGLMQQIGGPATFAFGWAAGVERIANATQIEKKHQVVALVPLDAPDYAFLVAAKLRKKGINVKIFWGKILKKILEQADKQNIEEILICGLEEQKDNIFILKNLKNRTQKRVELWNLG